MRSVAHAGLLVALATSWIASGGSFLGMRVVTQMLPPVTVTAIRMAGACLLLALPFAWRLRDPANRPSRAEVASAIVAGLLLLVLGQTMLVVGVSTTPAGTAAVFGSSSPLILALIGWWRAREPIGGRRLVGLLLGLAGLVLMGWTAMSEGGLSAPGTAAILFSSAAWAIGSYWGEHRALPQDSVVSITIQTITAAVALAALAPLSGEWGSVNLAAVPIRAWGALAFVVVTGLLLFSSFSWLNAHATGTLANTFTYVAPVLTLILGALLLGEPLTVGRAAAAAVTLVGVALIVTASGKERPASGKARREE